MKTEIGTIMCHFLNMKSADQSKAIQEIKIKSTKQKNNNCFVFWKSK